MNSKKPTETNNASPSQAVKLRRRTPIFFTEESKTKQAFKDECDINNIVKRLDSGVHLSELLRSNPQYGDFSTVPEYQEALNLVSNAHTLFENLPSEARERFENRPEAFLAFTQNPKNAEELIKMGLAVARPEPEATPPSGAPEASRKRTPPSHQPSPRYTQEQEPSSEPHAPRRSPKPTDD